MYLEDLSQKLKQRKRTIKSHQIYTAILLVLIRYNPRVANTEVLVTIVGGTTVVFNDYSGGTPTYVLRNTDKLLEPPSPRQTKTDKQASHGVSDSLSFYDERILTFDGEIDGSSQSDRKTKEEALKQCLALPLLESYASADGYYLIQITDEDGALKQCYAKIVSGPSMAILDDADPSRRGFAFVMMAKDPFLYGQTLNTQSGNETSQGTNFTVIQGTSPKIPFTLYDATPTSITCTNSGPLAAPTLIIIYGPTTSPEVLNQTTGVFMTLTGLTLASGERVEMDFNAKSITKYDASETATNASGYLSADSNWISLAPGANVITLLDSNPDVLSATISVKWRNTYL